MKNDADLVKNEYPPFSVAMSVYKNDNPIFFDRALQSITENQIVMPTEIVIIVDGPVDEKINAVIEKYSEKYGNLNVIRLDKNAGLGNALKLAIENAKYELIARMDSDDVSAPNRFEQQLEIMTKNSAVDIVGGDISEFIGDENNIFAKRKVPILDKEIKDIVDKSIDKCIKKAPWELVKESHQEGGPWHKAYKKGEKNIISDKDIEDEAKNAPKTKTV